MTEHQKLSIKYVGPDKLSSLDDLENGRFRRSLIVCKSLDLPNLVLSDDDVIYLTDKNQFCTVNGDTLDSNVVSFVTDVVELFTLTEEDINNKYVNLHYIPNNNIASLYIDGVLMYQGRDYTVSDTKLDWSIGDLSEILEINDIIFVSYRI